MNFKNILRMCIITIIVLFFCSTFLVSCNAQEESLSAAQIMVGEEDMEASPMVVVLLIIPAVMLGVWVWKEVKTSVAALISAIGGMLDFLGWLILKSELENYAGEYGCTVKTTWAYTLNGIVLVVIVVISVLSYMGVLSVEAELIRALHPAGESLTEGRKKVATTIKYWKCPVCNAELPAEAKFCKKCGTSKPETTKDAYKENICTNCGTELTEGQKFCKRCGTKVEAEKTTRDTIDLKKYVKPQYVAVVGVIIVVLLLLTGGNGAVGTNKVISLNEYVRLYGNGYNGSGEVSCRIDEAALMQDYPDLKVGTTREEQEMYANRKPLDVLKKYISLNYTPKTGLSNGDIIDVSWNAKADMDEVFNYKLQYSNFQMTVGDLTEVQSIDVFQYVDLVYEGADSRGTLTLFNNATDDIYKNIVFYADKTENLSNGDVITLTVKTKYGGDVSDYLQNYGVIVAQETKQITVSELGQYVDTLSEITAESRAEMIQKAEDIMKEEVEESWLNDNIFHGMEYVGCYFLSDKLGGVNNDKNKIVFLFKNKAEMNFENQKGEKQIYYIDYYYNTTFNNIIQMQNGSIVVDWEDYKISSAYVEREYHNGGWGWDRYYRYYGYETLEELIDNEVNCYLDSYHYETEMVP